jgi:hypothetical protein
MADNDYIGNIQSQRWNSLNQGYLSQTPSWMRSDFKQGSFTQQNRYQPTSAGTRQSWSGGEIRDTRTVSAMPSLLKATRGLANAQRINAEDKEQQAQAAQQFSANMQGMYTQGVNQAQIAPLQQAYQNAFKPAAPAPSTPLTTGVGAINQNLARWQTPAPTPNPLLTGYQSAMSQAAVAPLKKQYTNPVAPPRTFNPSPVQQQAITGVQQMKASRQPAKAPARTRAQKRGIAEAAFANIRQSLGNQ